MSVTVVVPWRPGCPHRAAAWEWVSGWYAQAHPDWQVITTGDGHTSGPWCKAAAVAAALPQARGDVLVVADADVICAGILAAVDAVASGIHPWAMPHYAVYRLTPAATTAVYAGQPFPDTRQPRSLLRGHISEIHRGVPGGGIVVLPRGGWDLVPLDARFTGWGQEDLAWGWALTRVLGGPWRGTSPLLHLWHPPQQRSTRTAGSTESMRLWNRYRRAYTAAEVMLLMAEPGARPPQGNASPDADGNAVLPLERPEPSS